MSKKLKIVTVILFITNTMFAQIGESSLGQIIPHEEITVGCLILGRETGGEHVITNNTEYQKLLQSRSPHSNCTTFQLPAIDFGQFTLIGYISSVGGCENPDLTYEVKKHNELYHIDIDIVQKGLCLRNNSIVLWCLIPKVEEDESVQFNIDTKVI